MSHPRAAHRARNAARAEFHAKQGTPLVTLTAAERLAARMEVLYITRLVPADAACLARSGLLVPADARGASIACNGTRVWLDVDALRAGGDVRLETGACGEQCEGCGQNIVGTGAMADGYIECSECRAMYSVTFTTEAG